MRPWNVFIVHIMNRISIGWLACIILFYFINCEKQIISVYVTQKPEVLRNYCDGQVNGLSTL